MSARVGVTLSDRYRLQRLIATGGMGQVWESVDTRLGRQVAIKVLKAEFSSDPEFVERKINEHGVAKVVPAPSTLGEAFTAFRRGAAAQAALKAEMARLNAEPVEVPSDLDAQVRAYLEDNPEETWDAALKAIAGLDDDEESGDGNA